MRASPLSIAACVLLLPALAVAQDAPAPAGPEAPPPAAPEEAPAPAAPAPPPVAAPPSSPDAMETLRFADHLFADGDWYRAITEYRRFLFQVRGRSPEAPRAALAIGEALLRGEQYDAAGRQLDGVAARTTDVEQRRTALFGAGRAYLLDQRPELAKPRLRLLAEEEEAPAGLRHEARWLLAWGHFDAGELDQAQEHFAAIAEAGGRHAEEASGAVQALLDREGLEQKNPLIAGALSLIPGVGHFYLGRWGVGLTSLAWNGLFIFAAASAWLTGNWGVALVLTFFEVGWYAGGVFGAVAGAMRHNRDVVRNWRDDVLLRYGVGRELPDLEELVHRTDAVPGTLPHFGASAME